MNDKKFENIQKLFQNTLAVQTLVGAILLLIASSSGIKTSWFSLSIIQNCWRVAIAVIGVIIILSGIVGFYYINRSYPNKVRQDKQSNLRIQTPFDKKIITSLFESLKTHNRLISLQEREYKRDIAEVKISERIALEEIKLKEKALGEIQKLLLVIYTLSEIDEEEIRTKISHYLTHAVKDYIDAVTIIPFLSSDISDVDSNKLTEIIQSARKNSSSPPTDPTLKVVYLISRQFYSTIKLSTALYISSSKTSAIFTENNNNPKYNAKQLYEESIRNLSLDEFMKIFNNAINSSKDNYS
jgi:hypothetical protein